MLMTTDAAISSAGLMGLGYLKTVSNPWRDGIAHGSASGMATPVASWLQIIPCGIIWA